MTRTGSIGSRCPPAVTSTFSPARSCGAEQPLRPRSTIARGLGEPTRADVAAGEPPRLGLDDVHAPAPQRREVLLHRRRAPTSRCASPGTRAPARAWRAGRCGQQVVGEPGGVRGEEPGGGGRDDDEVGGLTEPRVRDRVAVVPQRRVHRLRCERGERGRAHEALWRRAVMTGTTWAPEVDEAAAHLDGLVGGDAAGDAEDDAAPGQARHLATR